MRIKPMKELFKLFVLGDTKRPPIFYVIFDSPTFSKFKYKCSWDAYSKVCILMQVTLEKCKVEVSWSARTLKWKVLFEGDNFGTLTYNGTYHRFHSDIKRIIDFMCVTAEREYQRTVIREAVSTATREVNAFREITNQIEALEEVRKQKECVDTNRKERY
jgi:hypothetical protein